MDCEIEIRDSSPDPSTVERNTEDTSINSPASSASALLSPDAPQIIEEISKIISDLSNYVALGCLVFEDFTTLEHEIPGVWKEATSIPGLAFDTAGVSLSLSRLLRYGWARLESSRCELRSEFLIFRVYLLFYDVGLKSIDRSNKMLLSAVETVVAAVDTNPALWKGQYDPSKSSRFDMWASRDEENSSLFYIFNKVPSPAPDFRTVAEKYASEGLEDLLDLDHEVVGMKTSLYPYQRRSAGAMMHREVAPTVRFDMRLEERRAADESTFYYLPRDMQFLREPKYQEMPSGGILAETMGYGKTLICLALIIVTKHHHPKMPVQYTFSPSRPQVGSLGDMAISAMNRKGVPYKVELDRLRKFAGREFVAACQTRLSANPPMYIIPSTPIRYNRNTNVRPPQRILMASTTIVVVPLNLCKQWVAEIGKHVEPGVLKLLVMDDKKRELPPAATLATYDIILFARNRFDMEIHDGQDATGRRLAKNAMSCQCAYIGATRIRDCHCLSIDQIYSSPLKTVHFKRLIVDEGHFFSAGGNSRTMLVADKLVKADHRWVVSGTPAKDLLGVEVDVPADADREAVLNLRRHFDDKLDRGGAVNSLSVLTAKFLRATPWKTSAEAMNRLYRHEDRKERTFSGFSVCLRRMLEAVVVKTRPEDYERDVVLPPLRHDIVVLKPSFFDKLTANLFTLVLTANAVTSERTDADYLFHKNSMKARLQLVANLRQSAFFWSGFSEADVVASIQSSSQYLNKENTKCSDEDKALLRETLRCTDAILASKGWAAMSRSHELGVYVQDWPEDSAEHWSFEGTASPLLTGITQLLQAQAFVNDRLDEQDPGEGLSGAGIRSLVTATSSETEAKKPNMSKSGIPNSSIDGEPLLLRRGSHSANGKAGSPRKSPSRPVKVEKPKPKPKPKKSRRGHRSKTEESAIREASETLSGQASASRPKGLSLPSDSPYARSRIVGTTSAKLSYLITRILEHYRTEKILVFYSGDNSAFYISQFLELFHVKHEIYAKSLDAKLKAEYVVKFQEQASLRVLLMDVGQAAFGLNLCAASRVWFVNPVCKPDVEAQALKRAHRIGQTRPVMCETLVLADSLEQAMHERSQQMTRAEHLDAKALEDDGGIRAIIQNARVLSLSDEEKQPGLRQMAPLGKTEPLWNRRGWQEFREYVRAAASRNRSKIVDVTVPHDAERMVLDDD